MKFWARYENNIFVENPVIFADNFNPNEAFEPLTWAPLPNGDDVQGKLWDGINVRPPPPTDPDVLERTRNKVLLSIDNTAEMFRLKIITDGAGQSMEYNIAKEEATAALADPDNATSEKYPMLAASIGIDKDPSTGEPATDVLGVARGVKKAYDSWLIIGSAIKRIRLTAKEQVESATTVEDIFYVFDSITWPKLD